jgi:hypothetical protein
LSVIIKRVEGTGDVNAALMMMVAQIGKTFARKLKDEDPRKLRGGLTWLNCALGMIENPTVSTAEFLAWASTSNV